MDAKCESSRLRLENLLNDNQRAKCSKNVPVSEDKSFPGLEINEHFIHPFSVGLLDAVVDRMLTANKVINAMTQEGFISSIGSRKPNYRLKIVKGRIMESEDTFQKAGATDGCEVLIIEACID